MRISDIRASGSPFASGSLPYAPIIPDYKDGSFSLPYGAYDSTVKNYDPLCWVMDQEKIYHNPHVRSLTLFDIIDCEGDPLQQIPARLRKTVIRRCLEAAQQSHTSEIAILALKKIGGVQ